MLTPTHKPRLPNWLSFPVGAAALESAFAGIPQFVELDLQFRREPGISATGFRRVIEAGEPHVIVSAGFDRWDKRPSVGVGEWQDKYLRGFWSVRVFPVAREKKSVAEGLLLAQGLPALRRWFEMSRAPSWHWGRKRGHIVFDPLEPSVRLEDVVEAG